MSNTEMAVKAVEAVKSRLGIRFGKFKDFEDSTAKSPHGKVRVQVKGLGLLLEYKTVGGQLVVVFPWEISPLVRVIDPDEKVEIETEVHSKLKVELQNFAEEI